jgi:S1-C subfamily serine protease
MSKPTPQDSAKQLVTDRLPSTKRQYWMARLIPMLFVTALSISLPKILTQSFAVSEAGTTPTKKLEQGLRSISIQVLAHGESIGSGVLVNTSKQPKSSSKVYTIITNAHVIQAASSPFQVQTPDGQIYAAALISPPAGKSRDLSVLRFQSRDRLYATAKLASVKPKIGDRVWASGFPLATKTSTSDRSKATPTTKIPSPNIVIGRVTQILRVAIRGGYSIGTDQTIEKGMSGGPLINERGELVGINGVHSNPLWTTPDVLEDNSTVNSQLQDKIDNSSWAIPIEFIRDYTRL